MRISTNQRARIRTVIVKSDLYEIVHWRSFSFLYVCSLELNLIIRGKVDNLL